MSKPIEFSPQHIKEHSAPEERLFQSFLQSGEPYTSLFRNNPWLIPPMPPSRFNGARGHIGTRRWRASTRIGKMSSCRP